MKRFGLFGPPSIIFFNEEGEHIKGADLIGYQDADALLKHIQTLEKR